MRRRGRSCSMRSWSRAMVRRKSSRSSIVRCENPSDDLRRRAHSRIVLAQTARAWRGEGGSGSCSKMRRRWCARFFLKELRDPDSVRSELWTRALFASDDAELRKEGLAAGKSRSDASGAVGRSCDGPFGFTAQQCVRPTRDRVAEQRCEDNPASSKARCASCSTRRPTKMHALKRCACCAQKASRGSESHHCEVPPRLLAMALPLQLTKIREAAEAKIAEAMKGATPMRRWLRLRRNRHGPEKERQHRQVVEGVCVRRFGRSARRSRARTARAWARFARRGGRRGARWRRRCRTRRYQSARTQRSEDLAWASGVAARKCSEGHTPVDAPCGNRRDWSCSVAAVANRMRRSQRCRDSCTIRSSTFAPQPRKHSVRLRPRTRAKWPTLFRSAAKVRMPPCGAMQPKHSAASTMT